MKFGAGYRLPAFPPCLSAVPATEALAGAKGQFTSPVPCDAWAGSSKVVLEQLLVLLGERWGELCLRAGGNDTEN